MFAICIESSHARGLGHLYRSLTLADALRACGRPSHFLINEHASSVELIRARGHKADVVDLRDSSDWEREWLHVHPEACVWIDDRLDTDESHASRVKETGVRLVTFDDRGTGARLADLHIAALAFDGKKLEGGRVLCGVDYLLLDPALKDLRRVRRAPRSLIVTLGGSDTWGVTPRVMDALLQRGRGATVVLGPSFNHMAAVDAVLSRAPRGLFVVHQGGVPSLAAEMVRHDLAITGGGMTPFQANAIGLPCIVIANEPFEVPVGRALEHLGGSLFAGFHAEMDLSVLDRELPLEVMSQAGMRTIDLQGCERMANELLLLAERSA